VPHTSSGNASIRKSEVQATRTASLPGGIAFEPDLLIVGGAFALWKMRQLGPKTKLFYAGSELGGHGTGIVIPAPG